MSTYLPPDLQAGLASRGDAPRRRSGLRLVADGTSHPVLRLWSDGFAMSRDEPRLRGFVDLYDGARHIGRCLVIATAEEEDERRFEFKRAPRSGLAPPADYAPDPETPATPTDAAD
ncbi:hypothetical protein DRV85_11155 [Rhodosalinus halophilus]|uniref:Uncharacterized protein n=1 Tax=Rhodosalinus halophilus TaxID=2259333 RepID=A0A365U9F9_9RHOB|nr:hypothetical protein [Rhodosalinus halophilus]RBI84811.1 hypothetical protein DRV85_11155 [Rhodosalinus halophilus]